MENKLKNIKATLPVIIPIILIFGVIANRNNIRVVGASKVSLVNHPDINIEVMVKEEGKDKYGALTGKSVVSDQIELKVRILDKDKKYNYMEYKINGFNYQPAYPSEYKVSIDTKNLPDGWNQLVVIGHNEKVEGAKQIIFKVDNGNTPKARAERLKTNKEGVSHTYRIPYIPVLMYHDFQEEITDEEESGTVHPDLFESHITTLLDEGYTPINFWDLLLYMNGEDGLPSKPFIITADDGYLSNYETAFPILKKHQVPATFFVSTRYVGVDTSSQHFTWEQAKEMEESGLIDIQSHSHTHIPLSTLGDDEIHYEASVSFGLIEEKLGERDVKVLAYPQFYHNKTTQKILKKEGIQLQATNLAKEDNPTTKHTRIQRIHVANYTSPKDLIDEIEKLTN